MNQERRCLAEANASKVSRISLMRYSDRNRASAANAAKQPRLIEAVLFSRLTSSVFASW